MDAKTKINAKINDKMENEMHKSIAQKVTPMLFLLQNIRQYRVYYFLMLVGPVVGGFYSPIYNYAIKIMINIIGESPHFNWLSIAKPIAVFMCARLSLELGWRVNDVSRSIAEPLVKKNIILNAYNIIQQKEYGFFLHHNSANITSKIKGLVDSYEALSKDLLQSGFVSRMCKNVISIAAIAMINVWLGALVFVWSSIFMLVIFRLSRKLSGISVINAQEKHRVMGIIGDKITNILSIFLFTSKHRELRELEEDLSENFTLKQKNLHEAAIHLQFIAAVFYLIKFTAVVFIMIWLKKSGYISLGDFVFVFGVMLMLADGVYQSTISMQDLIRAINDWKVSVSILQDDETVDKVEISAEDSDKKHAEEPISGDIEFKDVTFLHNNSKILNNFNLRIKHGENVGVVGQSGSGKSTIIYILLRLFSQKSGQIKIGGVDIANLNADNLRRNISFIAQDATLFHKTVYENIAYGKPDASREDVMESAKKAHIHKAIMQLEHGYETCVGERGGKLSGGQRQRIIIARSILKNAPILILDEATSALDCETEADIQESLDYLMRGKTVISIAHKLNTLKNMDRIVKVEHGKIVKQ